MVCFNREAMSIYTTRLLFITILETFKMHKFWKHHSSHMPSGVLVSSWHVGMWPRTLPLKHSHCSGPTDSSKLKSQLILNFRASRRNIFFSAEEVELESCELLKQLPCDYKTWRKDQETDRNRTLGQFLRMPWAVLELGQFSIFESFEQIIIFFKVFQ